jgi:hypothetical protein
VLSHREASQSGAAAAAIAAGRWVVATRVGGIAEQLRDQPLARLCEPTAEGLVRELRLLVERPPMPPAAMPDDPRAAWRAAAAELAHQLSATLGRAVPSVDQPGLAKRPKEATSTS